MDFHEIIMQGKFVCEVVTSLPSFESSDEGRVLYLSGENKIYYNNGDEYIDLIDDNDDRLTDDRTPLEHDNQKHSETYAVESDLSDVATSGEYGDLLNIPSEFTPEEHNNDYHSETYARTDELFSGSYDDLSDVPSEFTPEEHGDEAHAQTYTSVDYIEDLLFSEYDIKSETDPLSGTITIDAQNGTHQYGDVDGDITIDSIMNISDKPINLYLDNSDGYNIDFDFDHYLAGSIPNGMFKAKIREINNEIYIEISNEFTYYVV
ncbi:MAG: hypothetical protein ACOCRK_00295 [bacterium]